ncbi:MAG: divalent-cation tolerance protein CutA [Planctomycetes bacterium]|nr:divalent-cation tolerance protein CutA [Planctomycetota bacterium]
MAMSLVYVTAASREDALSIGRQIVEERLAACANVLAPMTSLYWWEGRLEEGHEAVLLLKTRTELVDAVIERVRALHSYTCTCAISWPIEAGNPAYIAWIESEARPGA